MKFPRYSTKGRQSPVSTRQAVLPDLAPLQSSGVLYPEADPGDGLQGCHTLPNGNWAPPPKCAEATIPCSIRQFRQD